MDHKLGWRVAVLGGDAERHQVLLDHFDAVIFALRDDRVTVVRRYQSIQQLVHHLDLHVRSLEHLCTIYLLKYSLPVPPLPIDGVDLLELLLDHVVRLLNTLRDA